MISVVVPVYNTEKYLDQCIQSILSQTYTDFELLLIDSPAIIHYAGYHPWVYCKDKSIHSNLWWNTYKSLHCFPQVKIDYVKSIFKYFLRYVLLKFHLITRHNKYHIDQYYNNPKVTKQSVLNLI